MNKTPAALIPADHGTNSSHPDVDNLGISSYQVRPGRVYLSPSELINWSGGPWGIPYKALYMALQTCQLFYGTAPEAWQKGALLQAQNTPLYASVAGSSAYGAAPTSGVFTGISQDGCS
jgi:hypothetical protein